MILYRPIDGDVHDTPIPCRVRTCFLMTKLGETVPEVIRNIRRDVERILTENNLSYVDADSVTTGKDYLLKIWQLIISVPVGIAIISNDISHQTMANIFYELGWMQALGKETLVIKTDDVSIPSDFVRTEYVLYDQHFERHFRAFVTALEHQAEYFALVAEQVERNPLLSIDYYRRAFLLTGHVAFQERANEILSSAGLEERAKNSVEMLLADFSLPRQIAIPASLIAATR